MTTGIDEPVYSAMLSINEYPFPPTREWKSTEAHFYTATLEYDFTMADESARMLTIHHRWRLIPLAYVAVIPMLPTVGGVFALPNQQASTTVSFLFTTLYRY